MLAPSHIQEKLTEHKAIQEMLDTELSYNQSIALLDKVLQNETLVPESEVFTAFKKYIPQLKIISDNLYSNVTASLKEELDPSAHAKLKAQRTQLLKAFFTIYQAYVKVYESFAKEYALNPQQFKTLDRYISESNPLKLGLSDYLIQPFQRGPRYNLLIGAAIDFNNSLSEEDPARLTEESIADLMKAKELIREYMQIANSLMTARTSTKDYQFGDYTRAAIQLLGSYMNTPTEMSTKDTMTVAQTSSSSSEEKKTYQFGDYSRGLWAAIWTKPGTAASVPQNSNTVDLDTEDAESDFVVVESPTL